MVTDASDINTCPGCNKVLNWKEMNDGDLEKIFRTRSGKYWHRECYEEQYGDGTIKKVMARRCKAKKKRKRVSHRK